MINQNDYDAGWTKSAINPKTGKTCSGGAARNMKTALEGGAVAIYNAGAIHAIQYIQPVIARLETQLQKSNELNEQLVQLMFQQSKQIMTS